MSRTSNLTKCIGSNSVDQLRKSKVLLVGAGGIGCELLKDLILLQFGEIHVVDLDTIDLSNLNRQFLFRQRDIKQPKSLTAVKAVQKFSNSNLISYQGNIMDNKEFPLKWFAQFDIVYNALDNLSARRYVNKICQFTGKPLMESGTSGFDGYIQPIIPGETECFDCTGKETPKTFPVCTIRSTPSQHIHCIVWAKNFLFTQLFSGPGDEVRSDHEFGTDDVEEIARIKQETNELRELQQMTKTGDETKIPVILKKVFIDDINKLLEIENLWKTRVKPTPLGILRNTDDVPQDLAQVWDLQQNVNIFFDALKTLMDRLKTEPIIEFDKDDQDTLLFVASAANIRANIFHIPLKSVFDVKQIAGNIIPAIATTNAIIAGLSSLVSLRVLDLIHSVSNSPLKLPMAFTAMASNMNTNRYLSNPTLAPKNPKCAVCSNVQRTVLTLTSDILDNWTLRQLNERIVSKYRFTGEFSVLNSNTNSLIYDYDFDDLEDRKLFRFNFTSGTVLCYKDEEMADGAELRSSIEFYLEIDNENHSTGLELPDLETQTYIYRSPEEFASNASGASENAETLVLSDDEILSTSKKHSLEEGDKPATKIPKLSTGSQAVDIEDEDDLLIIN